MMPIMVRKSGLSKPKNWLMVPAARNINNPLSPENAAFPNKAFCRKDFVSKVKYDVVCVVILSTSS
jgi:hypothetical protein